MRASKLLYVVPLLGFFVSANLGASENNEKYVTFKNSQNGYNIYIRYTHTAGGFPIQRVLAPETVLTVRGDIKEISWNPEGKPIQDPIDLRRSGTYTLINFENARDPRPSIISRENLGECCGLELGSRGIDNLRSIFPALETRQKTGSWLKRGAWGLVGRMLPQFKPNFGFNRNDEVAKLTRRNNLDQYIAARYILALGDSPSQEEIYHAYGNYRADLAQASRTFFDDASIPPAIEYALSESKDLLLEQAGKAGPAAGDTFSFKNLTDQPVHVATYYVTEDNVATLAPGSMTTINPGQQEQVAAAPGAGPRVATWQRRRLVASFDRSSLKARLTPDEYLELPNADVTGWTRAIVKAVTGTWGSSLVYLVKDDEGKLKVLRTYEFGAEQAEQIAEQLRKDFEKHLSQIKTTLQQDIGSVNGRDYFDLIDSTYLQKRMAIVNPAFQDLLNKPDLPDADVPRVGIAFTGGGFRAMTETIGYLTGAEEQDLLKFVSYIAGLSGSTWALAAFLNWKLNGAAATFGELGDKLSPRLSSDLAAMYPNNAELIFLNHLNNLKEDLKMPSTDWIHTRYGFALAKTLFSERDWRDRQTIHLSDLAQAVDSSIPLPILTAISVYPETNTPVTFFEFSPYLVGTHQHGSRWIDSKYFGRKFDRGHTDTRFGMEEYLSYLMAICGSANAASLLEIKEHASEHWILGPLLRLTPEIIAQWASKTVGNIKLPRPKEFNFTEGEVNGVGDGKEIIHMIDGAHDILKRYYDNKPIINNFAAVPLLARNVDVLIMCDCTNEYSADAFIAAGQRAKTLGLTFPQVDLGKTVHLIESRMTRNLPTLIDDNRDDTPIIVYIPSMKDVDYRKNPNFDPQKAHFTSTGNFKYEKDQFNILRGLSAHSMAKAADTIKSALRRAYRKRKNRRHRAGTAAGHAS